MKNADIWVDGEYVLVVLWIGTGDYFYERSFASEGIDVYMVKILTNALPVILDAFEKLSKYELKL